MIFFQEKALHISSKEFLSKKFDEFKRDSEEMLRKVLFQVSFILYPWKKFTLVCVCI